MALQQLLSVGCTCYRTWQQWEKWLWKISTNFKRKLFMKFHVQGLQSYGLQRAHTVERRVFNQTVKGFPIAYDPANAKVVSSHVIYKVDALNDLSPMMKYHNAPYDNREKGCHALKSDSAFYLLFALESWLVSLWYLSRGSKRLISLMHLLRL